jgi:hypothetical protein
MAAESHERSLEQCKQVCDDAIDDGTLQSLHAIAIQLHNHISSGVIVVSMETLMEIRNELFERHLIQWRQTLLTKMNGNTVPPSVASSSLMTSMLSAIESCLPATVS